VSPRSLLNPPPSRIPTTRDPWRARVRDAGDGGGTLRLSVPGLLVADDVTSHRVELEDYLARVKSDPRLCSVTVPIGNCEEISLRLS